MGLSEHEWRTLRRIDADLDRQDPVLARRMARFTAAEEVDVQVSWRPPRRAVAVAAVAVAAAMFFVVALVLCV